MARTNIIKTDITTQIIIIVLLSLFVVAHVYKIEPKLSVKDVHVKQASWHVVRDIKLDFGVFKVDIF
jgi:hypothetical protein